MSWLVVGHVSLRRRLTTQDLFLPDTHLVIHQPVLLELITELNEVFPHRFHAIPTQQTRLCQLVSCCRQILRQVLLLLTYSQPTEVEVVPELETVLVEEMVVA